MHFNDDDSTEAKITSIDLTDFGSEGGVEVEYFILDGAHNLESIGKNTYYKDRFRIEVSLPNFTSYLIKLKKI